MNNVFLELFLFFIQHIFIWLSNLYIYIYIYIYIYKDIRFILTCMAVIIADKEQRNKINFLH